MLCPAQMLGAILNLASCLCRRSGRLSAFCASRSSCDREGGRLALSLRFYVFASNRHPEA